MNYVEENLRRRGTALHQVEEERLYEERRDWRRFEHGQLTDSLPIYSDGRRERKIYA